MALLENDKVDLEIDPVTGDLVWPLRWTTGITAVAQGIRRRILTFKGEWFLDLDHGLPYYQDLLGKKFDERKAIVAFRDAILSAPGVLGLTVLNVTLDRVNRSLVVQWRAVTVFGDTSLELITLGGV